MNEEAVIAVVFMVTLVVVLLIRHYFSHDAVVNRRLRAMQPRSIANFPDGGEARIIGRLSYIGSPIAAPLSGRRCALYHVLVEEYRSDGEAGSWHEIIDSTLGVDWRLDDGTGQALVRMSPIESVVFKDRKYRSGTFNEATPQMEFFLRQHDHTSKSFFGFNRSLRYKEGILEEGEEVTVSGPGRWMDVPARELHPTGLQAMENVRTLVLAGAPGRLLLVSDDVDTVQGTFNWLRRFRRSRGECVNCGYDLRGQSTVGCPECGRRR